jgi:type IV pilus assembly protein PilY1
MAMNGLRLSPTLRARAAGVALGALAALALSAPALADDTEIFVGRALDPGTPNVLFIIDTSGSMDGIVESKLPYDSKKTYTGKCPAGRVYWSSSSTPPSCTSDSWFNASALVCNAALSAFVSAGRYQDRVARWDDRSGTNNDAWVSLDKDEKDDMVECRADYGVHGNGVDKNKTYPAERNQGPWIASGNASRVIDWDDYSRMWLYTSNYVNYNEDKSNKAQTRLDIVKDVVNELLASTTGINVGLMRFSRDGQGGPVLHAMSPIETSRASMTATINALDPSGNTPLAETLYEAGQYYAGRAVDFGLRSTPVQSIASSRVGNNYKSPIVNQCQKNFVVLLTDGEPTDDDDADSKIAALPGFQAATGVKKCSGNCLDEMSKYLQNRDLQSGLADDQVVDTYTIGFFADAPLLKATAVNGNGKYYTADTADGLASAFSNVMKDIEAKDVTFTAPAISINNFNRLTHRNDLYFTLFHPLGTSHWDGNLKRYRLGTSGGEPRILDANDQIAIDENTNQFLPTAESYWTLTGADGGDTLKGGFRSRLTANRKVYTITGSNPLLSAPENLVHENNAALTASLLGVSAAKRTATIQWARGVDGSGKALKILGDAMHSVPVLISYGGSESNPDLTLYYTTNDGYLHALNPRAPDSGELELFSFIPKELLPLIPVVSDPTSTTPAKAWGLDGPMTFWIKGDNGNGVVDAGEQIYLYFAMRRGGRNYYALDVTDRANPRLAWTIKGGSGSFTELGQSWSDATLAKIKLNGAEKTVLVFAGGYDPNQDTPKPASADKQGRAVYIVDAETGARLWYAANAADNPGANLPLAQMTYSIPSAVRVIDMNGDGYDDRFYVGDMGGQIWRFDLSTTNTGASNLATGGVIASLQGAGTAGARRFYYPPSVSLVSDPYLGHFLSIAIGSGHRENPLGTGIEDRFYMIRDVYVQAPQKDKNGKAVYTAVKETNLVDVTNDLSPDLAVLNASAGWMIDLAQGEKVLAPSLTAAGKIFFTTYQPGGGGPLTCSASGASGKSRLYTVAVGSGGPRVYSDQHPENPEYDEDEPGGSHGDPSCQYRCESTSGPIPPEPVLVFSENEEPPAESDPCKGLTHASLVVGMSVKDPGICTAPVLTYWVDNAGQ